MKSRYFSLSLLLLVLLPLPPYASSYFFRDPSSIPFSFNKSKSPWSGFHAFAGCHSGQPFPGLSKLKNYFRNFGYIPPYFSATNFTDDYDDTLQAAVKQYQQNFHLNATGQLDTQTLQHIVRPRCGNPDIINGTNTMLNTSRKAPNNSSIPHTVSHYTFFDGMPRWPSYRYDLTYAFLPSNELSSSVKSVFARAFSRWSAVTPLTFTETDSYNSADITIGFYGGDHGDGESFDGILGTLAHSFSPTSGIFHLDIDETWVVEGDVSRSTIDTAIDLESVAVHEIGHVLGLGHSADEDSIMYPTLSAKIKKVELGKDDVEGIQTLYGSNPSYNASANADDDNNDDGDVKNGAGRMGWTGGRRWVWEVLLLLVSWVLI